MASISNNITQAVGAAVDVNVSLAGSGATTIITAPSTGYIIANVTVLGFPNVLGASLSIAVGGAIIRRIGSGASSATQIYDKIHPNDLNSFVTVDTTASGQATYDGVSIISLYIPAGKSLTATKSTPYSGGSIQVCGQTIINTP